MVETKTLDNGLRIVCDYRAGQVVYCGIAVDAGTRDQTDEESGMAHFIEHMSFKGTEHRRSWHIINRMESVGGDLNAYTGKEHTVYYCSTLRHHLKRAIDLLFDITLNSIYPQHELEKEREVVIDEIESYKDSPAELIYDEFEELIFPGHPLGRSILGDANRLRQYQSADLKRFARRLYHPSRMVLFVLGDVTMKEIERLLPQVLYVRTEYGKISQIERNSLSLLVPGPNKEKQGGDRIFTVKKSTHQAHVIVGTQACSICGDMYMPLYLLTNVLGGPGMNSRLNLSLRERRGLVYTVESSLTGYTDTGVWTTYFGCDHTDVERCLRLVHGELDRLLQAPLSPTVLSAAKRQLKGQVALAWENGENVAIGMGRRLLHQGQTLTFEQFCEQIDKLTASQILDVAQKTFDYERLITLVYTS